MDKVLLVGGSGMVGKQLQKKLLARGYTVLILGRSESKSENVKSYLWNIATKKIDEEAIKSADYIINLAGAGIADRRWTASRKKEIVSSRVGATNLLIQTIIKTKTNPKAFISASAIGYYGALTSDKIFTEDDLPSNDFLSHCCQLWEQSSNKIEDLSIRRVVLRIGVVLSEKGGALSKIKAPFRLGLGSAIGSGKQYIPWVHIDDLCECFIKAIEDPLMKGPYNIVSPNPTPNSEFSAVLAQVLKKPYWLPNIPERLIQLFMGEMAVIVTKGSRVSCNKILSNGFMFKYPNLKEALKHLLTSI